MKKIALAADHAGYIYKSKLIEHLTEKGFECTDLGTNSADSVNYPDYADKLCDAVLSGKCDAGILICGTGIGMSIAANRHKGIRAALCSDEESTVLCRQHNNANVLCMGARIISEEKALAITDIFTGTEFLGGRHQTRIEMLDR